MTKFVDVKFRRITEQPVAFGSLPIGSVHDEGAGGSSVLYVKIGKGKTTLLMPAESPYIDCEIFLDVKQKTLVHRYAIHHQSHFLI